MADVLNIFRVILLGFKRILSSVSLGGFTWWDLFVALWIFGIVISAIGFLFKQKGGK